MGWIYNRVGGKKEMIKDRFIIARSILMLKKKELKEKQQSCEAKLEFINKQILTIKNDIKEIEDAMDVLKK